MVQKLLCKIGIHKKMYISSENICITDRNKKNKKKKSKIIGIKTVTRYICKSCYCELPDTTHVINFNDLRVK